MFAFIGRRILIAIPTVILISIFFFAGMSLVSPRVGQVPSGAAGLAAAGAEGRVQAGLEGGEAGVAVLAAGGCLSPSSGLATSLGSEEVAGASGFFSEALASAGTAFEVSAGGAAGSALASSLGAGALEGSAAFVSDFTIEDHAICDHNSWKTESKEPRTREGGQEMTSRTPRLHRRSHAKVHTYGRDEDTSARLKKQNSASKRAVSHISHPPTPYREST